MYGGCAFAEVCLHVLNPVAGLGEYSYQQSSYGDQGYDRSFEESSQHYYEGGTCLALCNFKAYIL